jgi:flavin-binding protein dodecin
LPFAEPTRPLPRTGAPPSTFARAGERRGYSERMHIKSIARITEISSTSTKSFEDAIQSAVARATKTLRNERAARVKEQQIKIEDGKIVEYQVNLMITFVLEDEDQTDVA